MNIQEISISYPENSQIDIYFRKQNIFLMCRNTYDLY